ncbi:MAG TPA: RNase adapter RapZ, partial [Syntrophobacteria bacterium]|nr:RNase adapter RapZ [Syntrophobacteria bacterium]
MAGTQGAVERSRLRIVIVTGLSGSGKSTAIKAFEDLGYFCVDNLPVLLLPDFLKLREESSQDLWQIALGMDIRER